MSVVAQKIWSAVRWACFFTWHPFKLTEGKFLLLLT